VVLTSRSAANGEAAVAAIREAVGPSAQVSFIQLDLSDLMGVVAAADPFTAGGQPHHVLINNAGVMACPRGTTADGFEMQFGTNYVGHFVLTRALLPALKRSGTPAEPARVVNVLPGGHWLFTHPTKGIDLGLAFRGQPPAEYDPWRAYGWSKLANVLHVEEVNRRMAGEGALVVAVSLHPGNIMGTELKRHFSASWRTMLTLASYALSPRVWGALMERSKTTPQCAATIVFGGRQPGGVHRHHPPARTTPTASTRRSGCTPRWATARPPGACGRPLSTRWRRCSGEGGEGRGGPAVGWERKAGCAAPSYRPAVSRRATPASKAAAR
jgi:retinol dehydrogenase-12